MRNAAWRAGLVLLLAGTLVSGPQVAEASEPSGYWWHADANPVRVYVAESVPDSWSSSLKAASDQWGSISPNLLFTYGEPLPGRTIFVAGLPEAAWNCSESPVGCTGAWELDPSDPTKLLSATIYLNTSRLSSLEDVQVVFIHELGHAIGLEHEHSPLRFNSVMWCVEVPGLVFLGEGCLSKATLGEDDVEAVQSIYGRQRIVTPIRRATGTETIAFLDGRGVSLLTLDQRSKDFVSVAGGASHVLIAPDSPDLLYHQWDAAGGNLWIAEPSWHSEAAPKPLTSSGGVLPGGVWGPGGVIAFESVHEQMRIPASFSGRPDFASAPQIYLMDKEGTPPHRITDGKAAYTSPAFSSDGMKLYYVKSVTAIILGIGGQLYIDSQLVERSFLDGTEKILVDGQQLVGPGAQIKDIATVGTGDILFLSTPSGERPTEFGMMDLWSIREGSGLTKLASGILPGIAPRGKRVLAAASDDWGPSPQYGTSALVLISESDSQVLFHRPLWRARSPTWSVDGEWAIFDLSPDSALALFWLSNPSELWPRGLWAVNVATGEQRHLVGEGCCPSVGRSSDQP